MEGTPSELELLHGSWDGEYTSGNGRCGRITFNLGANQDHASGLVLMIPQRSFESHVSLSGSSECAATSQAHADVEGASPLTIRFVQARESQVTGTPCTILGP